MKKHGSQVVEQDQLKLKVIVSTTVLVGDPYDSVGWVCCCRFDFSWLSSVNLVCMNYVRLNPLDMSMYVAVMAQPVE